MNKIKKLSQKEVGGANGVGIFATLVQITSEFAGAALGTTIAIYAGTQVKMIAASVVTTLGQTQSLDQQLGPGGKAIAIIVGFYLGRLLGKESGKYIVKKSDL